MCVCVCVCVCVCIYIYILAIRSIKSIIILIIINYTVGRSVGSKILIGQA